MSKPRFEEATSGATRPAHRTAAGAAASKSCGSVGVWPEMDDVFDGNWIGVKWGNCPKIEIFHDWHDYGEVIGYNSTGTCRSVNCRLLVQVH